MPILYHQSCTILQGPHFPQWIFKVVMTRAQTCNPEMRAGTDLASLRRLTPPRLSLTFPVNSSIEILPSMSLSLSLKNASAAWREMFTPWSLKTIMYSSMERDPVWSLSALLKACSKSFCFVWIMECRTYALPPRLILSGVYSRGRCKLKGTYI